jgi:hypothetical protein
MNGRQPAITGKWSILMFLRVLSNHFHHFPSDSRNSETEGDRICVMSSQRLQFFYLRVIATGEKRVPVHRGVVDVRNTKALSVIFGVCIAVIRNDNVTPLLTKAWTSFGTTINCPRFLFSRQPKSLRREVVRILQRETKTFQTVIRLYTFRSVPVGHP